MRVKLPVLFLDGQLSAALLSWHHAVARRRREEDTDCTQARMRINIGDVAERQARPGIPLSEGAGPGACPMPTTCSNGWRSARQSYWKPRYANTPTGKRRFRKVQSRYEQ